MRLWAIEQVLNLWLRQEQTPTPQVFDMIESGQRVFAAWVEHLEDRSVPLPDASALVALAESLRIGGEVPAVAARPQSPHRPRLKQRRRSRSTTPLPRSSSETLAATSRKPPHPPRRWEVLTWPLTLDEAQTPAPSGVEGGNVRRASATVVLGHFGGDKTPPAPTVVEEVVDLPPLALDEPASDLEDQMFAGAWPPSSSAISAAGEPAATPEEVAEEIELPPVAQDEAAPANADTLPQPGTEAFDNAATM